MKTHEEILKEVTGKSPQYLKQNFITFNQCIEAMDKAQTEVKNCNILAVSNSVCDHEFYKHQQDNDELIICKKCKIVRKTN